MATLLKPVLYHTGLPLLVNYCRQFVTCVKLAESQKLYAFDCVLWLFHVCSTLPPFHKGYGITVHEIVGIIKRGFLNIKSM